MKQDVQERGMFNDHYGLSGRPFQLTPDPRFYFESATHKKAMAYLGYGLEQGEGFVVVTGEIGAGKTTLTGHLLDNVDPVRVRAIRVVSTRLGGEDLLRMVAAQLGVVTEGLKKAEVLDSIETNLLDHARTGQKTLIIVDEAQGLSNDALEELRMLSNFQAGEHALVQLFLLGQPEFKQRLDAAPDLEQLRQRVIATHHLTAMEKSEIRPYLEHRLRLVGWTGTPSIEETAIDPLFRATGGMPRRLNTVMTRVLLMGAVENTNVITGELVENAVADYVADGATPPPAGSAGDMEGVAAAATARANIATDPMMLDLAARVAMLESHAEEQGIVLRRLLELLVERAESDAPAPVEEFLGAPNR
jgi:general secretion pathway protein A